MNPALIAYGSLAFAIVCEVAGTSFLQRSEQFTRLGPSVATILFYVGSFYLLSHAIKVVPLGLAYAIWGGVGIVLTAAIGVAMFGQRLDTPALIGIALIVGGVVVVNVFSKMSH